MASSTLLKDLEENFFLCSVCLDQFKEPKLLPCLHRYCSDCLETVIQGSMEGEVECPMCKQQCVIPENGVDGFKTDFHMKNILEFIQLQKLLENKDLKECVSCQKKTTVSAYCFKCRDFLCDQCHNVHVTSKMFIDHKKRTLKLDNNEHGTLTLEKLARLSENPRCRSHEEEYAKLCCTTCGNEPVCIICTYTKHKGHELGDVRDLAKTERDILKRNLDELSKCKNQLYELPKKIEASKQQLNDNSNLKREKLIEQHRQQSDMLKRNLDDQKVAREKGLSDIENRRKVENCEINMKFEDELKIMTQKYDKMREETQTKFENECHQFSENCDKIKRRLSSLRKKLDDNLNSLTTATQLQTTQNNQKLSEISDYCDQIIKRYENFTATTSSILASEVDWTDVRCIPDLNSAWEVLIEDMKTEFPDVKSFSVVDVDDITELAFDYITVTEDEEYIVEGILASGWYIDDIAIVRDGKITITGSASKGHSHITVISKNGEIKQQDRIKSEKVRDLSPYRCCSYLTGSIIATVCQPDEIGIYDASDCSYKKNFISEVTRDWSEDQVVVCVATDPVNNHIIVGTNRRHVYVFDNLLNYIHTINLPDTITGANGIIVHDGSLIVCDYHGSNRAYAVTMEGTDSKIVFEFTRPIQDEGNWSPSGVCTDQNRFIYLLWYGNNNKCTLVQYSQDGRQVLREREVKRGCEFVAASADSLLITSSNKIYIYGLKVT